MPPRLTADAVGLAGRSVRSCPTSGLVSVHVSGATE